MASKVVKMLEGTLRRGSGMIGSGGGAGVAPVIDGPRCISEAESCGPVRPLGAALGVGMFCGGIGTVCADKGTASVATEAAINSRANIEARRGGDSAE